MILSSANSLGDDSEADSSVQMWPRCDLPLISTSLLLGSWFHGIESCGKRSGKIIGVRWIRVVDSSGSACRTRVSGCGMATRDLGARSMACRLR